MNMGSFILLANVVNIILMAKLALVVIWLEFMELK